VKLTPRQIEKASRNEHNATRTENSLSFPALLVLTVVCFVSHLFSMDSGNNKEVRYKGLPNAAGSDQCQQDGEEEGHNDEVLTQSSARSTTSVRSKVLISSSTISQLHFPPQNDGADGQATTELERPLALVEESEEGTEASIVNLMKSANKKAAGFANNVASPAFTKMGEIKKAARISKLGELTQQAAKMAKIGELAAQASKMKNKTQAALVDFIPILGSNSNSFQRSRLHRASRLPLETINTDELDQHPLHKACALSALLGDNSGDSSSSPRRSLAGGDLKTIARLVEQDPSQLHLQLPSSGDTPLHVAVRFGALQGRQVQNNDQTRNSNLAVIEYLIQADVDNQRRKHAKSKDSGGLRDQSLGVADSALYIKDKNDELPLHIASEEGFEKAARTMLKFDKDAQYGTICVPNDAGELALHLAVLRDSLSLVKLLLLADASRERLLDDRGLPASVLSSSTIYHANSSGDLPIHLALPSPHQFTMWNLLLEADETKESLQVSNEDGVTAFHFFVDQPKLCEKEPDFVDAHLADAVLNRLLSGKRLERWDNQLRRIVSKSQQLQLKMNVASANRLPASIFIADFYAHSTSTVTLFLATDDYLTNGPGELPWTSIVLLAIVVYFGIREVIQLLLSRDLYWTDIWNYLDVIRLALLVVLVIYQRGEFNVDVQESFSLGATKEDLIFERRLLLATAVFIFIGLVSFLRMTYLPFALFVGGTSSVLINLIPFMITFALAMGLFAYGYWIGGFFIPYGGFATTYSDWLLFTFMTALDGPENVMTLEGEEYINKIAWGVIYSFLTQVLLLNVLIAILSTAWEQITEEQNALFWQYRLEYAAGVLPVERFLSKHLSGGYLFRCVGCFCRFIDALDRQKYRDDINWGVYPYSEVIKDPSMYWDERLWRDFLSAQAEGAKIGRLKWFKSQFKSQMMVGQEAGKVKDSLRGNKELVPESIRSFQADFKFATTPFQKAGTRLRILAYIAAWVLAFLSGLLTLGFTWPRSIRVFFCAPSTNGRSDAAKDAEATDADNFDVSLAENSADSAARRRQDALERKLEDMHETIEGLKSTVELLVKLQTNVNRQKTTIHTEEGEAE